MTPLGRNRTIWYVLPGGCGCGEDIGYQGIPHFNGVISYYSLTGQNLKTCAATATMRIVYAARARARAS